MYGSRLLWRILVAVSLTADEFAHNVNTVLDGIHISGLECFSKVVNGENV